MATEEYANSATTTVSSGGTTAPSGGTSESWTVASSTPFPAASTGTSQFHVVDQALPTELITVTNVSGTTWTVTRGAESTTPVAHTAGFTIYLVVTAADVTALLVNSKNLSDVSSAATARTNLGLGGAAVAAIDSTASDFQPDGVAAAGATAKVADAGHAHPFQPWQFAPEAYGAVGNGKVIADAVLASNTTLTSATAAFTNADTGKTIMINGGAGTTSAPLVTTITYVSATTVTLGTAASVTGTVFQAVYGTDDTAAINSALTAAKTYALANQFFAEIVFGAKIYMLTSGPTQSTSPQFNAQIPVPYPSLTGTNRKLVIALTGAGDNGWFQFWESLTPNLAGTSLVSTVTAPSTPSGTYGQQSVIGGPSAGGAFSGGFADTKIVVRNIEVVCGCYTNIYAYDFAYLAAMRVQQSSAHIFAPSGFNGGNEPTLQTIYTGDGFNSTIGLGLRAPVQGNNADVVLDDVTVEGYNVGFYFWDHATAGRIGTTYNVISLILDVSQGNSGLNHQVSIQKLSAEAYVGGISLHGGYTGTYMPVDIAIDTENTGTPTYDIYDPASKIGGIIRWMAPIDIRAPIVNGAQGVQIVNDNLGPGQWTNAMTPAVPAVPATTVAQQNTAWRDATVYLTSGGAAVTVIKVDSVTTGLTLGSSGTVAVRVPGGHSITLTYASTAPTWVWVLE